MSSKVKILEAYASEPIWDFPELSVVKKEVKGKDLPWNLWPLVTSLTSLCIRFPYLMSGDDSNTYHKGDDVKSKWVNSWQMVCTMAGRQSVHRVTFLRSSNKRMSKYKILPQSCFPGKHLLFFFKQRIIMNALSITNIESQSVCLLLGTGFIFISSYSLFFWYCNINSLGKKALW